MFFRGVNTWVMDLGSSSLSESSQIFFYSEQEEMKDNNSSSLIITLNFLNVLTPQMGLFDSPYYASVGDKFKM